MSRSYRTFYGKESWFYNQDPNIGYRTINARKTRRFIKNVENEVGNGNWYRKYTNPWDIHDYGWSYTLRELKKYGMRTGNAWYNRKMDIKELYRYVSK